MYYANNPTFVHSPASTIWIDWVNGFMCRLSSHAFVCTCAFHNLCPLARVMIMNLTTYFCVIFLEYYQLS